ncbi:me53 [Cryptophlebia leucotreta granulovirus]|uniref:Me53 n=1 Tax=Cryptophlebia leucotreta granulosis virus TaxID=35254 RepID=Q66111_GVCL|nr:me53 [Cryptophlebia leucotreta granulovirus]AAQ21724.1 me53 [Cryptophlebia leucotreta granulovirus]
MHDFRIKFLSKEIQEVLNSLVGLAQNLHNGINRGFCFVCNLQFKQVNNNNPFIFIVVTNYLNESDDTLKFCCLKCWQNSRGHMDIVELYPTLKLYDVKKLMYNNVLRKFLFNFRDTNTVLYKKYAINDTLDDVLKQVFREKNHHDEIQMVRLIRNENDFVAEENIAQLRIEYGTRYTFDRPLLINGQLINSVNNHCKLNKYYLEVFYKSYEPYSPFMVCFNIDPQKECVYCEGKILKNTGHPIFNCSHCGLTNPNYFIKKHTMMIPFWTHTYDYNKVYWKSLKHKGMLKCDLMVYGVDTRRNI